jgi:phenylalanyl-tRNA synthetase alpha subunit
MSEERKKIEEIREAFEQEFGRFADLKLDAVAIADAEAMLRDVAELKIRHTGKKSAIAGAMKLIGKIAPEERSNFGQFVQSVEKQIVARIDEAESKLNAVISKA